jgi:4-amino-4-deoxy-L-arabinose transferase-like glycosyltransferase
MSHDVSAFFFAGFDPAGIVTVDKPSLAFWTQTLGVAVFGFHAWVIALVQVVEGVAAVFVLHRVVCRWAEALPSGAARADRAIAGVLFDCGVRP